MFEELYKYLKEKYTPIMVSTGEIFIDEKNQIVAKTTKIEENGNSDIIITIYFDDNRIKNSHYGRVALAVTASGEVFANVLLGNLNDVNFDENGNLCLYGNRPLDTIVKKYNPYKFTQCSLGTVGQMIIEKDEANLLLGDDKVIEGIKFIPPKEADAPYQLKANKVTIKKQPQRQQKPKGLRKIYC